MLLSGCSSSDHVKKARPSMKVYLGASHGGIVENTDLSLIENTEPDAYTGATSVGVQGGIHYEYPFKKLSLETGIDAFMNNQTFTYYDDYAGFHGSRDLLVTQLRIPLQMNFRFLRENHENGMVQLKLGLSPGFCFNSVNDQDALLPSYEKNVFTVGPIIGIDFTPLTFENGSALGVSLELSRSFQSVYSDYYQLGEMPGLSYLKFGFVYRLGK
ncbi:MAG: hypothetical protein DRI97_14865 [Bacteroidetes bacterium]|nr:MAG: hypothetical protein DRI97_14865 [Bacteroidota bacterium]